MAANTASSIYVNDINVWGDAFIFYSADLKLLILQSWAKGDVSRQHSRQNASQYPYERRLTTLSDKPII